MGVIGPCRRRLLGLVAGARRGLAVRLWARPPVVVHATGSGAGLLRSRAQLLAKHACPGSLSIRVYQRAQFPVPPRRDGVD